MLAGASSRFGGKPKGLVRVGPNNETLVEFSIMQALKAKFDDIIFIVSDKTEGPYREVFKDSFRSIPIHYVKQQYDHEKRSKPWGTTDALVSALPHVKNPFVICNGDDIYGTDAFELLYEHLQTHTGAATIGYKLIDSLPQNGVVNRGIFIAKDNHVKSIKELFNISRENFSQFGVVDSTPTNMNIFALWPTTVRELSLSLAKFKQDHIEEKTAEAILPVDLGKMIERGTLHMKLYSSRQIPIGITNPQDEETVRHFLKRMV